MADDKKPDTTSEEESARRGYEVRDANTFAAMLSVLAVLALSGVVILIVAFLFDYWRGRPSTSEPVAGFASSERVLPPEPRLQTSPATDLKAYRAKERALLYGYGWINREQGVVHIPIDRAIDLVAERGLPDAK